MNIRQLNEIFNLYQDGKYKYADIDAKSVYDNCINKDFGSHTFEEADKFKEFVGITKDTNEEELRGIRNTLVRYWADECKKYSGDDWGRSRSKEESDRNWKMGDQMQFFTTVIDMTINALPEEKRMHEDLQLVDKADPDFQLGDAYIAKNKEDLINGLDKLTLGDTIGVFVNYLDEDGVTGELNVEMVDEDLFKISMEEYTKENADDWEGKDVLDTEFLTKEETIYQLNLILEHLEIIDKLNEDRLFPTKFDTLPKKNTKFNIGDKVNINGINGEIIKIKPMKMSDTSTYQIKLDNGKTVWRYEEEINESLNEDNKFDYMMLSRLEQDCKYFLGYGNGYEKHLWAGNVEDQIAEMRKIYNKLPEKPQWLSLEDIDKYEKDMLAKRDSKDESLNEAEGIYSPKLILQAYKKEQEWLKENNYEIGETPDIQLFIIENNEIVGCTYVPRKDVYTYQPEENEYYLDMVRDSGDVLTDYNLEPAQKLVDKWNESKQWESLKDYKEVGKILQNKKDGGFNVAEANEPMLTEDQPTLKSLLNNLAKYL